MDDSAAQVRITDNPDRSRFELRVAGTLAGRAEYRRRTGRLVFTHTEIEPEFQGRGLASMLARAALDSARDRGARVTALCPFVAGYVRDHPEYADLVDQGNPEEQQP